MANENTADTNVVPFPMTNPQSVSDIAEHARLIKAYRATARLQKVIARALKACQDSPENADACLRSLPAKAKARIALRGAIKRAFGQAEQSAYETLMQEHVYLDRQKKLQQAAIEKLQDPVLAAHPKALNESQRLVRLVSSLVALKRASDKRDRSDTREASLSLATPANALVVPFVSAANPATK